VNKNDLVQKLAERTGLSKMDAQKAVDGVFEVITDSLKSGDEVRVTGFGVFVVSRGRAARAAILRPARKSSSRLRRRHASARASRSRMP
jgi:nucleoid DNA-binding protein